MVLISLELKVIEDSIGNATYINGVCLIRGARPGADDFGAQTGLGAQRVANVCSNIIVR